MIILTLRLNEDPETKEESPYEFQAESTLVDRCDIHKGDFEKIREAVWATHLMLSLGRFKVINEVPEDSKYYFDFTNACLSGKVIRS